MRHLLSAAIALALTACAPVEQRKPELGRRVSADAPLIAGVGDTVLDLKLRESLPNVFGKADIFGRTRDTGRVVVRYIGAEGDRAYFVRQDILISSNDTTMSRTPLIVPTVQQSTASGYVGRIPVSGTQTTTGYTYVPAAPSSNVAVGGGQLQLSAPVGGVLIVEGRTVSVLRIGEGSVEYSIR
jgi:hypothetical protein